jgi:biotin operon repressor
MENVDGKPSIDLGSVFAFGDVRMTKTSKVAFELAKGPAHIDELMAATGLDEVQVRSAIRRLRDRGLFIARVSKKTYAWLPARGLPFKQIERAALTNFM